VKTALICLFMLAVTGCRNGAHDAPTAVASASASAAPAPSASAAPVARAWYIGTWSGTYEARLHKLDLPTKQGGLPEWKLDDGQRATGSGTLSVVARDDGAASGSAEGPLGEADLRGAFGEDLLTLRFSPKEGGDAFAGVVIARRDGERLVGTLQASTPDGHVAREGTVAFGRGTP
jgi:hypothetical protein